MSGRSEIIRRQQDVAITTAVCFVLACLGAFVLTLAAYAFLFTSHVAPGSNIPMWVKVAVPLSVYGPASPSGALFTALWLGNVMLWGAVLTVPVYLVMRFRSRTVGG